MRRCRNISVIPPSDLTPRYEFEQTKANNLLFYGLGHDSKETPAQLVNKIENILRVNLDISRDIPLTKASRLLNGPEVSQSSSADLSGFESNSPA